MIRYSTGRHSPLPHATGVEIEQKRGQKRSGAIKYSTGEGSMVKHATGMDLQSNGLYQDCSLCQGSGKEPSGVTTCPACGGKGRALIPETGR
ncbi:MAG: hypothetical protein ACE5HY_03150 [Candidatus Hydrothermarchaeales archaeon]